jgi:hypothetical protein
MPMAIMQGKKQQLFTFALIPEDGLYALAVMPLNASDKRHDQLVSIDITDNTELRVGDVQGERALATGDVSSKPASKLGVWYTKILWIGRVISLVGHTQEFGEKLTDFCANYHAPLSIPPARKTYQTGSVEDLADLSIRFLGVGS